MFTAKQHAELLKLTGELKEEVAEANKKLSEKEEQMKELRKEQSK